MAATVQAAQRTFKIDGEEEIVLPDPDPSMDMNTVKAFYLNTYPQLLNAKIKGPEVEDGKAVYTFQTEVGHKG